jgi:hypothetical protein
MDIILVIILIVAVIINIIVVVVISTIIYRHHLVVFFDQCNRLHLANHSLQQLGADIWLHSFLTHSTCNLRNIKSENMHM